MTDWIRPPGNPKEEWKLVSILITACGSKLPASPRTSSSALSVLRYRFGGAGNRLLNSQQTIRQSQCSISYWRVSAFRATIRRSTKIIPAGRALALCDSLSATATAAGAEDVVGG